MFNQVFKRCLHRSSVALAKASSGPRIKITSKIAQPESEKDTNLLATKCCGLNYLLEGEDPVLKSYDEYPEWLTHIHTGKPKTYLDMDPNTREYWFALEKAKLEQENAATIGKGFYRPPKTHEVKYISRIPKAKRRSQNSG